MVDERVPQGAGLSSSVALECAAAAAVFDLFDLDLGLLRDDSARATLAGICVMAEKRDRTGPTRGMDQSASLRCHGSHALLECRDGSIAQVPLDLSAHGFCLPVMDTWLGTGWSRGSTPNGARAASRPHDSGAYPHCARWRSPTATRHWIGCRTSRVQARARHVVTKIERVRRGGPSARRTPSDVGPLFKVSHASM